VDEMVELEVVELEELGVKAYMDSPDIIYIFFYK
jgi:hypothetical protein